MINLLIEGHCYAQIAQARETSIRTVYMSALRTAACGGGPAARKPRYVTMATDEALTPELKGFLMTYTLRPPAPSGPR